MVERSTSIRLSERDPASTLGTLKPLMSSARGAAGAAEVATEAGMLLLRLPSSCWKPRAVAELLTPELPWPPAAAADADAAGAAFDPC